MQEFVCVNTAHIIAGGGEERGRTESFTSEKAAGTDAGRALSPFASASDTEPLV